MFRIFIQLQDTGRGQKTDYPLCYRQIIVVIRCEESRKEQCRL